MDQGAKAKVLKEKCGAINWNFQLSRREGVQTKKPSVEESEGLRGGGAEMDMFWNHSVCFKTWMYFLIQ